MEANSFGKVLPFYTEPICWFFDGNIPGHVDAGVTSEPRLPRITNRRLLF